MLVARLSSYPNHAFALFSTPHARSRMSQYSFAYIVCWSDSSHYPLSNKFHIASLLPFIDHNLAMLHVQLTWTAFHNFHIYRWDNCMVARDSNSIFLLLCFWTLHRWTLPLFFFKRNLHLPLFRYKLITVLT